MPVHRRAEDRPGSGRDHCLAAMPKSTIQTSPGFSIHPEPSPPLRKRAVGTRARKRVRMVYLPSTGPRSSAFSCLLRRQSARPACWRASANACWEKKGPCPAITRGAPQYKSRAQDCDSNACQRNLIRADSQPGQAVCQILRPSRRACIHRPPIGINCAVCRGIFCT